jgi:valyl-tRNA synthetase
MRFCLASMAAPGTDIILSDDRLASARNFANKIWNAARFLFVNLEKYEQIGATLEELASPEVRAGAPYQVGDEVPMIDAWLFARLSNTAGVVGSALENYRFHEAAQEIYQFFWGDFCDWYIELVKPRLAPENGVEKASAGTACGNLVSLFEASLRLLHPVMPFITEEIWHAVYDGKPPLKSIALAAYPQADDKQFDLAAETSMAIVQDLIVSVRNLRAELKVEQKQKVPIQVYTQDAEIKALLDQNRGAIERLANVESLTFVPDSLANLPGARSTARFDVHVVYEKEIDIGAERERLKKELEQIEKEIANGQRQLSNEQFLAKAPAKVVDGMKRRAQELAVMQGKTKGKLEELKTT